ncbi:MAG: regulatory protein RecX [Vicinamibacterales bacterium]
MIHRRRPGEAPPRPTTNPRTLALRMLGRRDYSTAELTTKLLDKGYAAEEVERVISGLVSDRFVDDTRVAQAHVRTASRIKGRGHLRIRRELEARGISPAIVREATLQISPDEQLETLTRLVARKRGHAPMDTATRRRLFQQLLRRGFPADLIAKALSYRPDEDEQG